MRVIDRVAMPALIITAEDDPFVPPQPFRDPRITQNPHIRVVITRHGGHCAFLSEPVNGDDGYWAESQIVQFAQSATTPAT
jgi:predicted alpha/beta-fold hydrolase